MSNSKLIGVLTGLLGALVGVFICAVAGVDFSASSKSEYAPIHNELSGSNPTNITQLSPAEVLQSEMRLQIQQLQSQLNSCSAESSRLRMDALTSQMNQQRR